MMHSLKLQVSLMRLFWGVKATFADAFAIYHNLNQPFVLMSANPKKTRFVCFSWCAHILKITKSRHFAKVLKSVVLFISVDVVNVVNGKATGHVQPRQTVSKSFLVVYGNSPIPHIRWAARTFTNKIRSVLAGLPYKFSSVWVVNQNGFEMVSGNHEHQFTIGLPK